MKKRFIQLALALGLMALACVAAYAADEPTSGFRVVEPVAAYQSDITLKPLDESGAEVTLDEVRYPGAVKLKVSYSKATAGNEYLLCVLVDDGSDSVVPTADNMAYIDQVTAESAIVQFTAFPKKPESSANKVQYSVWLSSDVDAGAEGAGISGFTKIATFEYYFTGLDYTLGDVDADGSIMVGDAVMVLRSVAELITLTDTETAAADVNKDGSVAVADAVAILRFVAEQISSFEEVQNS